MTALQSWLIRTREAFDEYAATGRKVVLLRNYGWSLTIHFDIQDEDMIILALPFGHRREAYEILTNPQNML